MLQCDNCGSSEQLCHDGDDGTVEIWDCLKCGCGTTRRLSTEDERYNPEYVDGDSR